MRLARLTWLLAAGALLSFGCAHVSPGSRNPTALLVGRWDGHINWSGPTFRRPSKRSLKYRRGRPGPHDRDCPGRNAGPPNRNALTETARL